MKKISEKRRMVAVAPLVGSVDRNYFEVRRMQPKDVAPLVGSVDRNHRVGNEIRGGIVAPLVGSVDRNMLWRSS